MAGIDVGLVLELFCIFCLLAYFAGVVLWPSRYGKKPIAPGASGQEERLSVQVLVLGDIGRSPRMQYHALSVARHGGRADLIGYHESAPHPHLINNPNVTIRPLRPPPGPLRSNALPFLLSGPLKVIWQIGTLVHVLGYQTEPAKWLLVQNPPSIPTLAVAFLLSTIRNTHLIIDWHNYGWTILAGTKGPRHPFVALSKIYECLMGQIAPTANVTVTHAMERQLRLAPYHIESPILTLHDRPAAIFRPLAPGDERREILERLPETASHADAILLGRARLVVSSTSWTPDEDFSLLLDALVRYAEGRGAGSPPVPAVLAVITGRGPEKARYQEQIRQLEGEGRLPGVRILTAWLAVEDYAALLRCADLGVSLHTSSSGVDLPMKVVDMFGSGLPVAAYSRYESFGELVREGENGCGFGTGEELAGILSRLFGPEGGGELRALRRGAEREGRLRWDEEWDRVLGRLLRVAAVLG